jgi:thiamine biosynthesis lipoprotein
MRRILSGFAVFICAVFLTACAQQDNSVSVGDFAMDTWMNVSVFYRGSGSRQEEHHRAIAQEALEAIKEIDAIFSRYIEGSDIWRINNAGGEWVTVSDPVIKVLEYAEYFRQITNGGFDVTIGAVSVLWDFTTLDEHGRVIGTIPLQGPLSAALTTVGHGVQIDGNRVRLNHPQAQLDMGAIAKGYAADVAADVLRAAGVAGIINAGGDVVLVGEKPDGTPWGVGIPMPFTISLVDEIFLGVVYVGDASVVASGTDQRRFERGSRVYHHILDVNTGFSVDTPILMVSIISDSGIMGEGLTTAMFVMGPQAGLALIESIEGVEVVMLMEADGSWLYSSGVNKITEPPTSFPLDGVPFYDVLTDILADLMR